MSEKGGQSPFWMKYGVNFRESLFSPDCALSHPQEVALFPVSEKNNVLFFKLHLGIKNRFREKRQTRMNGSRKRIKEEKGPLFIRL